MSKLTDSPNFKPFMKKVALMGAVLSVAGLVLKLSGDQVGESLLITGMGTLAVTSFFLGKLFPCPSDLGRPLWAFSMTISGYTIAIAIIGLLFLIQQWYGAKHMLILAAITAPINLIAWLFYFHIKNKSNNEPPLE